MKRLLILLAGGLVCCVRAETNTLPQRYSSFGDLIVTQFVSAPFPHPNRADGHTYHDQLFDAKDHYSDGTVAIFIPKGFHETGKIDFVVHFHGWRNHVVGVLARYQLIEQFSASKRNAILVVPQGPRDAPDSFGGKLEDPDGFKHFMDEVTATLRSDSTLTNKDFQPGNIVLSGHSGGYQVISSIVDRGGLTDHVAEVWLFDALYAQTDKFLAWFNHGHGRWLDIYTEHGGTKGETETLMATLKQRGTPFCSGKEAEVKAGDLKSNRMVFVFTDLEHNDVLDKHQTFREFLETSCLSAK